MLFISEIDIASPFLAKRDTHACRREGGVPGLHHISCCAAVCNTALCCLLVLSHAVDTRLHLNVIGVSQWLCSLTAGFNVLYREACFFTALSSSLLVPPCPFICCSDHFSPPAGRPVGRVQHIPRQKVRSCFSSAFGGDLEWRGMYEI